jgi:hypothetical protein
MQTGSDLVFSWIYFTEENSWTRSMGRGLAVDPGPWWTKAVRHSGREGAWLAHSTTAATAHRRGRMGRGDEGDATIWLTEARATTERRRDGDGRRWCFGNGEGMRGGTREEGNEWGRCGDRRGVTRPIYRAEGRSAGAGSSVMAGGRE